MKNIKIIWLCLILGSCNLVNPDEELPAYIKIDQVTVKSPAEFYSNSQNISDVWTYADQDLLGAFELPTEIPILADNETELRFYAGIYKDGIRAKRINHPYIMAFDTVIRFVKGTTVSVTPRFEYSENFDIALNENFENPEYIFEAGTTTDSILEQTEINTKYGVFSGILYAQSDNDPMQVVSKNKFKVETRTSICVLEFDYRSSVEFSVGVLRNSDKTYESVFRPKDEFTKIYMDFSSEVGVYPDTASFKLFFDGVATKEGDFIQLDNIRLLTPN